MQFLLFPQCFQKTCTADKYKPGLVWKDLTHYHTVTYFDTLKIYICGKHCEKRRNGLLQAISPFLTMFSTLHGTYFSFLIHFKMLSAICFNLDKSKILFSYSLPRLLIAQFQSCQYFQCFD